MAGRVPLDTALITQRRADMPMQQLNVADIQAQQQQGAAIASGVGSTGKMLAAIAQQGKESDIKADQAALSMYAKSKVRAADEAAGKTSDPKEVKRIYDEAYKSIDGYVRGSTDGVPHIKWSDHEQQAQLDVLGIKDRVLDKAQSRTLQIYKSDTQAKAENLYEQSIAIGDMEGVEEAASILVDGGLRTPEEKKLMISEAKSAITKQNKAVEYNKFTAEMSELAFMKETDEITNSQEIDALKDIQSQLDTVHEDNRPVLEARVYSRLTKAYKQEKKELNDGFKRIASGLSSGSYDENELRHFLSGRVNDYDDLLLVAKSAEKTLAEFKPAAGRKGGAVDVLLAVEEAANGLPIGDAVKKMKDSNSALAPFGMIMLGSMMMAEDSGADEEAIYTGWVVDENTLGPANTPVKVAKDSILYEHVRKMGAFIAEGDEDAKWIEKSFFKAVDIQNNSDLSNEEKRTKMNDLFKGRASELAALVSAPQVQAQSKPAMKAISTKEEYDALPSGSKYIHPDGSTRTKR
jgi:hypothetical protein